LFPHCIIYIVIVEKGGKKMSTRRNGGEITGFGNIPEETPSNIVELPDTVRTAKCSGDCGRNVILPRNYVFDAGIPVYCGPKGCRKSGAGPPALAF
jgi:hypothetical protein